MTMQEPFRSAPGERCSWCAGLSAARCPRCNRQVCPTHAIPPESMCAGCAEHELLRVSRAGGRLMNVAFALIGLSIAAAYLLSALGTAHGGLWAATIGLALVSMTIVLAGFLSRRLARRRVVNERALSTVERETIERHFGEEVAA
jgi:uncharacterized membrane protein YeaQ/YmgE (transglycosylase-associated protein family)